MKELFDGDFILGNFEGDLHIIPPMLNLYLNTFEEKLFRIKEAASTQDGDTLTEVCHQLRGSVSQLGGQKVKQILLMLEDAGNENDFLGVDEQVELLEDSLYLMEEEIKDFMSSTSFEQD